MVVSLTNKLVIYTHSTVDIARFYMCFTCHSQYHVLQIKIFLDHVSSHKMKSTNRWHFQPLLFNLRLCNFGYTVLYIHDMYLCICTRQQNNGRLFNNSGLSYTRVDIEFIYTYMHKRIACVHECMLSDDSANSEFTMFILKTSHIYKL